MRWGHLIACTIVLSLGVTVLGDDFTTAAGYYSTGQWQEAVASFDRLLRSSPDHAQQADAQFFRGEALVQLNRYDEAIQAFGGFLDAHADHALAPRAQFRIGECQYLQGQTEAALGALRHFIDAYPNHQLNEFALPYLGLLLADSTTDVRQARRVLSQAAERYPHGSLAEAVQLRLIELEAQQHDRIALQRRWLSLESEYPGIGETPEGRFWRGVMHQTGGNTALALQEFQHVALSDAEPTLRARALLRSAELQHEDGNTSEAIANLESLAGLDIDGRIGEQGSALLLRLYLDTRQANAATRLLKSFLQQYPNASQNRNVRRLIGESQLLLGNADAAATIFRALTTEAPEATPTERAVTWYQLASAYHRADKFDEALSALEQIETESLPPDLRARIEYARGSCYVAQQRPADGIEAFEQAIAADPESSFAHRCRWQQVLLLTESEQWNAAADKLQTWQPGTDGTWFYRQAGRQFAEAAFDAERYDLASTTFSLLISHLSSKSDSAYGLSGLAWCTLRQQKWQTAAKLFHRLVRQFGNDEHVPQGILAYAYCLEKLEDDRTAIDLYREFIQRFPKHPSRWRADLKAAELLQNQQAYTDALHVLQDGLVLTRDPRARARMEYLMAWLHWRLGQDHLAVQLFEDIRTQGPSNPYWADATYRLAKDAYLEGNARLAEQTVEDLLAPNRNSQQVDRIRPYAIYLKARIAAQQSQWQAVLLALDELQVTHPNSPLALAAEIWSIDALYRLGDASNVQYRLRRLRDVGATLKPEWQRLVDLRDAQTLAEQGKWRSAVDIVQAIADGQPHNQRWAEANLLLGRGEIQLERFAVARIALGRLVDSREIVDDSTRGAAWCMIGQTYTREGMHNEALNAYLQVPAKDDSQWYAAALYGAAESLSKLGRNADASAALQRLTLTTAGTPYRTRARELVQQPSTGFIDSAELQLPVSMTSPSLNNSQPARKNRE